MEFENTPKTDGGSYEKPKEGKYIGVLVGFCYIGTHGGGQYGPKPKVMLRWELHKRRGPSLDSTGFVHTITQTFGATIRGENSLLRKCIEAHGIALPEGAATESRDWLGRAAWLDLEESADKKWINVVGISKLDPDDDGIPEKKLQVEHWEGEQDGAPPPWANWAIAKSSDLAHLAAPKKPAAAAVMAPATADTAEDDDDAPRTGRVLFAWVKQQEQLHGVGLLKYLNGWARLLDFPVRIVDWDEGQVRRAYAEICRKLESIAVPATADDDKPPF